MYRLDNELDRLGVCIPAANKFLIILDVSVYLRNDDFVTADVPFSFEISEKLCGDPCVDFGRLRYGHRYPNKCYTTVATQIGRKVSRCGCLALADKEILFNRNAWFQMQVCKPIFEAENSYVFYVFSFPVVFPLFEKDTCCTSMIVRVLFNGDREPKLYVRYPYLLDRKISANDDVLFSKPVSFVIDNLNWLIFKDTVEFPACRLDDVVIIT